MPDLPLIYANTVLATARREPGVYEVVLGAQGFEQAEPRAVAGLALTEGAARDLARAVQGEAEAPPAELEALRARHAALRRDAAHAGVVLTGLQDFAARLMREYRHQPDFEQTLVRVADEVVRTLKATEIPDTAMQDEAAILSQALETFFDMLDTSIATAARPR
jgi:hypothetical protein